MLHSKRVYRKIVMTFLDHIPMDVDPGQKNQGFHHLTCFGDKVM